MGADQGVTELDEILQNGEDYIKNAKKMVADKSDRNQKRKNLIRILDFLISANTYLDSHKTEEECPSGYKHLNQVYKELLEEAKNLSMDIARPVI